MIQKEPICANDKKWIAAVKNVDGFWEKVKYDIDTI